MTIKNLRQSGYKVRVMHSRYYDDIQRIGGIEKRITPKGGSTRIQITTPNKELTEEGFSECSNQDLFNRRTGISIALGRAIKELTNKGHTLKLI